MNDKLSVLIIDDEPDIRDGVSMWLGAAGFETRTAKDGVLGYEAACNDKPDAILLDMMMPRQNGIETLGQLRANPLTNSIPVTMLSASLRDEQHALDAGAKFFVKKPYCGKNLAKTIRATIEN